MSEEIFEELANAVINCKADLSKAAAQKALDAGVNPVEAINEACEKLKAAGAKRALPLKVGGAFHSPLMQPAKDELQAAIEKTDFNTPKCPVYQNVDGMPHTDPAEIKKNLIAQLTSSVKWTKCVQSMIADGADDFTECGPGKALQGMIGRIDKNVAVHGIA